MKTTRRFSRRKFVAAVGLAGLGTVGYARWIESSWLGVGRHSVKLATGSLSQPIKILQLSDLHASDVVPLTFIEKAVRRGLELKPDLILLTGDFVSRPYDNFDDYTKILRRLSEQHPCYATLGNHDGGRWAVNRGGYANTDAVRRLLDNSGIALLNNRSVEVSVQGNPLQLVGL